MERLTERDEFGNADIIALSDMMPEIYAELSFSETNVLTDALNRLAAYEDTGLEPEEIEKLCDMDRRAKMAEMLRTEEWYGISIDRLRELVQADRDRRCVVLPCKVGDTIYKLFCGDIVELEVERIVCWSSGYWKMNAHTEYSRADWKGFEIDFSDFGKTVFLTREAAEEALRRKQ